MKVLLANASRRTFATSLPGTMSSPFDTWAGGGVKNGDLLQLAASEQFEAFVTTDRALQNQQHVAGLPLAVIILHAPTNDLVHLEPFVPALLASLNHVQPGTVTNLTQP